MKNKAQLDGMPVWFDGKSINEALFCEEFLQKIGRASCRERV